MEQVLFDDLVQSLKEAKAIARGDAPASRRVTVTLPDVKAVREQIGLPQSKFARLMRVSIKTLQNWEQHRRTPTGPAAALLKIVLTAPDVALKTLDNTGTTLRRTQKPAEEITAFEKLVATYSPDDTPIIREQVAKAMFNIGVALGQKQKPTEEIATYEKLIDAYSHDNTPTIRELVTKAMFNMGVALGQMQKSAEEIATYEKLIATYSHDSTSATREQATKAMFNMGVALGQMQKPAEKVATSEKLIDAYLSDDTPTIREQATTNALNKEGFLRLVIKTKKMLESYDDIRTLLDATQTNPYACFDRRMGYGITRGNPTNIAAWLLGDQQAAEESFPAALAAKARYFRMAANTTSHTTSEDDILRGIAEHLWSNYEATKTARD